ncbi:MAG TPA: two-component regulator propeller domain-containing protein, partial [Flavobacterium sp.]|nr:two-component regulator propeller domain-containing protein [Flavobacterium sp.]
MTKQLTELLLVLTLLLIGNQLLAQEKLYFESFDVKSGLPENSVSKIVEDKLGYIWMATQRGVVRYDGYNYKVYLLEHIDNQRSSSNAASLYVDRNKNIWVGTIDNGVFKYNYVTDSFIRIAYPKNSFIQTAFILADDKDGNLWGIWESSEVHNSFWRLTPNGKFESFGSQEKGINLIPARSIYDIITTSDGNVLVATSNGIYRYDGPRKLFSGFFNEENSLPKEWYNLYESPSKPGVLWSYQSEGDFAKMNLARIDSKRMTAEYFALPNAFG